MKSIGQKLILISFILAIIASGFVFTYLKSLKEIKEEVNETTILVASETIPPGTLITQQMVKKTQVPENSILIDYIEDSSEIIGKYTKETILQNEGFHVDKLISTNTEELSLRINDNHRAVSINVTGDSGISHLVKPGDAVDIVVYLDEKKDGDKVVRPELSKVILQNITLLAIDKQLNRYEDAKAGKEIPVNFLVTLSVSTSELEKLVLAENTGILKLALRPLRNIAIERTNGITWDELVADLDEAKDSSKSNSSGKSNNYGSNNEFINYKIKPGDTLVKISKEFYGDPKKYVLIKEANNINNDNLIITGEVIKIPIAQ